MHWSWKGSSKTHGSPLGEDLIERAKRSAGFSSWAELSFVPEDVLLRFRMCRKKGGGGYLGKEKWEGILTGNRAPPNLEAGTNTLRGGLLN